MPPPSKAQGDKGRENWRISREDELLKTLTIKCKVCDAIMRTGHQEGTRFYHCRNKKGHKDGLERFVWVDIPEGLLSDRETDTEFSCEKKADKDPKD